VRSSRCFGLFDAPKAPDSTPVYGALRQRPTSGLTKRINAARYLALAITPHVVAAAAAAAAANAKPGGGQPTLAQLFEKAAPASAAAAGAAVAHAGGAKRAGARAQPTVAGLFARAAKKQRG
jgi:hypothetical protein